jgi:nucleoid DNA-binding protein
MNEKITFQAIAARLAEKSDIPLKEAEKFLKEWSNVINEGLFADKLVKIKSLGTLKLVEVNERESIDVSTGNRVVIPAHYKINFTAENTLANTVNAPFAIFETIELQPDEAVPAIEEKADEDEEEEEIAEKAPEKEKAPEEKQAESLKDPSVGQHPTVVEDEHRPTIEEHRPKIEQPTTHTKDNSELIEAIDSAIKAIEAATQVRKNGFSWTSAVLVIILLFQQLLFAVLVYCKLITIQ